MKSILKSVGRLASYRIGALTLIGRLCMMSILFAGLEAHNVEQRLLDKLEQCQESQLSPEPKGLVVDGQRYFVSLVFTEH